MSLQGKTLFITGASRGIGLAIARKAGSLGANVVIAAKSAVVNPKLPGTIFTDAAEVEAAGGKALAIKCDIRDEANVEAAMAQAAEHFGGIDVLVNNASAIWLQGLLNTPMKRFDLMSQVNSRGTFLCAQKALPYLLKSENPHILTLAPPPNLDPKWWGFIYRLHLGKNGHELRHPWLSRRIQGACRRQCLMAKDGHRNRCHQHDSRCGYQRRPQR